MRRISETVEVELVTVEVTDEWRIEVALPDAGGSVVLSAEQADRLGAMLRAEAAGVSDALAADERARRERLLVSGGVF